ncbi:methyltransferase [Proteus columbae]|uniref:methyltransferase n=1 Tax=Proteus columbae TaxID=1987580 RepID=UPI0034D676B6
MKNYALNLQNKADALAVMKKAMSFTIPAALRVAAKLNIADLLKEGSKNINELAEKTNSIPVVLNRILRMLASEGIFSESEGSRYSLAPAGYFLLSDHEYSLRDAVLMLTNETLWRPVGDVIESVQGNPAFENLYGMPFYQYWQDNVRDDHDFQAGMNSLSKIENYFIIKHYEFPEDITITDIAGGLGGLLLNVLKENPTLKGQLFDRPHVLERTLLTELNDNSRWKLISGDLFGEYPESDIYLIKYIIHDWDDESVIKFFKNFRNAMKPNSKILIIEPVIFKKNVPDMAKYMDLLCMSAFPESGERTEDEFIALLDQADLKINKVIKTGTYNSILEVVIK